MTPAVNWTSKSNLTPAEPGEKYMPAISDPEAVNFSDRVIRPLAYHLREAYRLSQQAESEWFGASMSNLIPDTTDVIADGADTSGGHDITGAQATAVITAGINLCDTFEANTNSLKNIIERAAVK